MAVRFILGTAGSGKTSYCIDAVLQHLQERPRRPVVLLVPEQATYLAEKAILAAKKVAGYYSPSLTASAAVKSLPALNVLSFDRLVFLLLGKNSARRQISKIGRQMVIRRILEQNSDKLRLFSGSVNLAGLSQKIAQTIAELQQYAKSPEDVEHLLSSLSEKQDNLTSLKFADIALIFSRYLKFIEGRFLDPDVLLNLAVGAVSRSDALRGACLFVDGFAGFTGGELAILTELMKVASDVRLALCLEPETIDKNSCFRSNLFAPIERTYHQLIEIVQKCKLQLDKPVSLKGNLRFAASPVLAHIEQNIFKFKSSRLPASDNIRIVQASNPRAEVQFVAGQVLQLVRRKGLRFRDIAVIAPDLSVYEHYIKAYFDDYGIPFFIDSRKSLRFHPAVCFILSALRAAVEDFSNSDIFDYLKSGLAPIDSDDVDLLENYCLAYGIRGGDWTQKADWNFGGDENPAFDCRRINRIRRKAIEPLLRLKENLCLPDGSGGKISPEHFTRQLFDFLDGLALQERISQLISEAVGRGDFEQADEHRQLYDALLDVFDELCDAFEGLSLNCADYLSLITAAFSQMTLALIPPTLDQVLVGSIERSRHPDIKAAFLIGLTNRDFPSPLVSSGVLSDTDRLTAESLGFQLAPTSFRTLSEGQYLAYIAFTRASEFLFLTYPLQDRRGRPVVRSRFIDDIVELFDDLQPVVLNLTGDLGQTIPGQVTDIYTVGQLRDFLCSRAGSEKIVASLLNSICRDKPLSPAGSLAAAAVGYENIAGLDKSIVKKLFAGSFHCSATRLETFAECPYRFFARCVLELEERKEFKIEPLDLGIFYHRAIDSLFRFLKAQNIPIETIAGDRLVEIIEKIVSQIIEKDSYVKGFCRHSRHNMFILVSACSILQDCILSLAEMIRAGRFRPVFTEAAFGNSADLLGEFEIPLAKGRSIFSHGKIDRLDLVESGDGNAAVIFDYKRRARSFRWSHLFYGLDLQLVLYMLAVRSWACRQPAKFDVAGAFYIPVESESPFESESSAIVSGRKATGLFNGCFADYLEANVTGQSRFYNFYVKDGLPYGHYHNRGALRPDDFDKVLKFAQKKLAQLPEQILTGRIDITPYRLGSEIACEHCDYKSVCRFDWRINDYNYLITKSKQDVIDGV